MLAQSALSADFDGFALNALYFKVAQAQPTQPTKRRRNEV